MQATQTTTTLHWLRETTIIKKHAAVLLGLHRLANDLEVYCQHLEDMITHPDAEPIMQISSYYTPFELN